MNSILRGSIFVAIAASCYGVLTTFVKLAYHDGFSTREVTLAQLLIGFVGLSIANTWFKKKRPAGEISKSRLLKSKLYLALSGTSLGFTSIFYCIAMNYISVSVGIVLLMQSVWMGVVLDVLVNKVKPTTQKIIAVLVILIGTSLAANLFFSQVEVSLTGIFYGFLAALSYTVTIFTSNRVGLSLHSISRSKWMMTGGLLVVSIYAIPAFSEFNFNIFILWGPILALFGTILPPLFFTAGMPEINVGLGAIVSAIELPVAAIMGYLVLNEAQNFSQWLGIFMILFAIVFMNLRRAKKVVK